MNILQAAKKSWNHWTMFFKTSTLRGMVLEDVKRRLKFMVFADLEAAGSHLLLSNMLGATSNVILGAFSW